MELTRSTLQSRLFEGLGCAAAWAGVSTPVKPTLEEDGVCVLPGTQLQRAAGKVDQAIV